MTRTFIPHRCHASIGVLGAVSVATACMIAGSTAHALARVSEGEGNAGADVGGKPGSGADGEGRAESGGVGKPGSDGDGRAGSGGEGKPGVGSGGGGKPGSDVDGKLVSGSEVDGNTESGGDETLVSVEHPSGETSVMMRVTMKGGVPEVSRAAILRTARKLFEGQVFPRSSA